MIAYLVMQIGNTKNAKQNKRLRHNHRRILYLLFLLIPLASTIEAAWTEQRTHFQSQPHALDSPFESQVDRIINQKQSFGKSSLNKMLNKFFGMKKKEQKQMNKPLKTSNFITMFMCGDVMTGRGIDQVLPHPSAPVIYESYMRNAKGYVELAETANGPIPKPVSFSYIWGDASEELERLAPDLRLINLETSVTKSDDYWKGKGINYRMHPNNIPCLTEAKIDYCSLSNNHVLDWGYSGLNETLDTLKKVNIKSSGAGLTLQEAETPAVLEVKGKGRVIVFSYGSITSGIPFNWAATANNPGVNLLKDLSDDTIRDIKKTVNRVKQKGDILVASIHWGSNWGYEIPSEQIDFAHNLIDKAGFDVIHGHSSHHVRAIEVYQGRLILYGCGDFLNDYEGISGYEHFRDDLTLMYFVSVDPLTGKLVRLQMTPLQIKHFRLNRALRTDVLWLRNILNREGKQFGTKVQLNNDSTFTLQWD